MKKNQYAWVNPEAKSHLNDISGTTTQPHLQSHAWLGHLESRAHQSRSSKSLKFTFCIKLCNDQ